MLRDGRFWFLLILALAVLTLAGLDLTLRVRNGALRAEIDARQTQLDESQALARFNSELIQRLATLAVQTDDVALRELLEAQGVRYRVTGAARGGGQETPRVGEPAP